VPYHFQDKAVIGAADVPLRLLDCLGFTIPVCFFAELELVAFGVVLGLRFGGGGGFGAGFNTGEDRNAVGDGIVIVSILTVSYIGPSTSLEMARANTIYTRSNRCVVCVSRTFSVGGNFPHREVRSVSCFAIIGGRLRDCQKENVESICPRTPKFSEQLPRN
jgi:hypothetical protein